MFLRALRLPRTRVDGVEAHLSVGDSGGAVFVFDMTTNRWELAGNNTSQTKSQSGIAVGNSNFREDVNIDGFVDSVDASFVKAESGTTLPVSRTMGIPTQPAQVTPLDVYINAPNNIQGRFENKRREL